MADAKELTAALERLIGGAASDSDVSALRAAHSNGVLVSGERAVALGGNATDVSIVSGDQIVFSIKGGDAATVLAALNSVTPARRHQVPPPPADFTGRTDEQRELLAAIEQGGVTISGLLGMGGIGKTALALKLVQQLKPRYSDAQIYLDLKGASTQPMPVTEALAHVIRSYLPAAKLPESENDLRALYLTVLDGQRALLLMDNAIDAKQVEPLIPPPSCALVVTSRWHFTLPGMVRKNLDALSVEDARSLLLAIAPRMGEWADEIAKLCGYLPLALRLAASALTKYRNLKIGDYVQRLKDHQARLQLIDASLSLSYELLNDELKQYWRLLAVFPDSFADDAAAAVCEIETDHAPQILGELMAASMLEWNETLNRYRLHDLARLFADSKLSDEDRVVGCKRHATHYKMVLTVTDDLYLTGGQALIDGLALFDIEWSNIAAGHAWVIAQGIEADRDVAELGMLYSSASVRVFSLRLHPREWIRWWEFALAVAERLKDRQNECSTLVNLGVANRKLGEIQRAIQFLERALVISLLLGDRRNEGIALGNLGGAYLSLGEIKRAIRFHEQHLSIAIELDDRRGKGSALGNLGIAYNDLGDLPRALQYFEQALEVAREIGDRRYEAIALGNVGLVYFRMGESSQAIPLFEQNLNISRELGDQRSVASALFNMSLALNELGQRLNAIEFAEQSVAIFERLEDPATFTVRALLAKWREEMNNRG